MTMKIWSRDLLSNSKPHVAFPPNLQLRDHVREVGQQQGGHRIYEFTGTDTFGVEWVTRQRFEVDAGRDEEPLLYLPLYDVVADASLPKNVDINRIGPGGVIFEEVFEGGEVKFSHIGSSEYTVPIRHWGTGLEYSKDLVIFNELWNVALIERQMGVAHNALLNHLHLNPFIAYAYAAANQTAANTGGATTMEDYLLTIQDAITASKADTTNPRRGPYTLLISSANMFMMERALSKVPQTGFTLQTSAIDMIRNVIAYDGWSGTRGSKTVTYAGVTSGKAYLISQQYRGQDARSFEKQALQNEGTERDLSRFLTQSVWDSYYGVYANPLRCAEEITLP
jgi:hypothetical protein